jgi:hypothetical protein
LTRSGHIRRFAVLPLAGILVSLWLVGCAARPGSRPWGEDVTVSPGWQAVGEAAMDAARDPWVWIPLAGAAGLQIDNWDRDVSDWARRETPLYGSKVNAESWSDDLRDVALLAEATTVMLAPSSDDTGHWAANKARGIAVDLAAIGTASAVTSVLKTQVGRTRPSGTNDESFPSGHTSAAATLDRLAARNLEYFDMNSTARKSLTYGLDALTIATAWARVEAGAHYPSDTLFSIALGNFCANFFRNAFIASDKEHPRDLTVTPMSGGVMLHYSAKF